MTTYEHIENLHRLSETLYNTTRYKDTDHAADWCKIWQAISNDIQEEIKSIMEANEKKGG